MNLLLNLLNPTTILDLLARSLVAIILISSVKICESLKAVNTDCINVFWQQYDEKNIRRRVYDALNVLMAMDIISKDKKEIQWKGLPRTNLNDIEELKVRYLLVPSTML